MMTCCSLWQSLDDDVLFTVEEVWMMTCCSLWQSLDDDVHCGRVWMMTCCSLWQSLDDDVLFTVAESG
ncbi:hypothetical protein ACOMHN_018992 [Nucella lapillus]